MEDLQPPDNNLRAKSLEFAKSYRGPSSTRRSCDLPVRAVDLGADGVPKIQNLAPRRSSASTNSRWADRSRRSSLVAHESASAARRAINDFDVVGPNALEARLHALNLGLQEGGSGASSARGSPGPGAAGGAASGSPTVPQPSGPSRTLVWFDDVARSGASATVSDTAVSPSGGGAASPGGSLHGPASRRPRQSSGHPRASQDLDDSARLERTSSDIMRNGPFPLPLRVPAGEPLAGTSYSLQGFPSPHSGPGRAAAPQHKASSVVPIAEGDADDAGLSGSFSNTSGPYDSLTMSLSDITFLSPGEGIGGGAAARLLHPHEYAGGHAFAIQPATGTTGTTPSPTPGRHQDDRYDRYDRHAPAVAPSSASAAVPIPRSLSRPMQQPQTHTHPAVAPLSRFAGVRDPQQGPGGGGAAAAPQSHTGRGGAGAQAAPLPTTPIASILPDPPTGSRYRVGGGSAGFQPHPPSSPKPLTSGPSRSLQQTYVVQAGGPGGRWGLGRTESDPMARGSAGALMPEEGSRSSGGAGGAGGAGGSHSGYGSSGGGLSRFSAFGRENGV